MLCMHKSDLDGQPIEVENFVKVEYVCQETEVHD